MNTLLLTARVVGAALMAGGMASIGVALIGRVVCWIIGGGWGEAGAATLAGFAGVLGMVVGTVAAGMAVDREGRR